MGKLLRRLSHWLPANIPAETALWYHRADAAGLGQLLHHAGGWR